MAFNEEHHRYLPENLKVLLEEPPTLYKVYPIPVESEPQTLVKESYFPRGGDDSDDYALVAAPENKTDTSTKTSEEEEKRRSVTKSS